MNLVQNYRILSRTPVLFVLLAVFWGTSFVAIEVGLHYFPPLLFAAIRYDVAGLLVLAYAVARFDSWRPRTRGEVAGILVAGLLVFGAHHSLLYLGQQYVSGSIASVLISLSPVLTAGFAGLLLSGESLDAKGIVGLLTGLTGVVIVLDSDPAQFFGADTLGIGLVFLSAVSFALGSVLTRPFESDLPIQATQGWAMVLGAVLLHLGSYVRGESASAILWTPSAVASFVYLTLISGVLAFSIYFVLLERIGPAELNLVGYLEPVTATLVGLVVLGQPIAVTTVTGFVTIFAGFTLVKRDRLVDLVDRRVGTSWH
ncbi:DMT family transporter [Salinirubrum litoreum]|uniref:DMT family transporter n=1 Tax=Salinirubrum litoreum TaxID=1126234 RepID=A0ABD5R5U7_9EURY|nr:EamA family transporter [Salinirubrum litoreum]